MPERLIRSRIIKETAPVLFQILWGPDGPGGRKVIEAEDNLSGPGGVWDRMNIDVNAADGYNAKLSSGEWLLTDHTDRSNVLSAHDYIEVKERTARLQGGRVAHTNSEITREVM